jgi:tRNA (guanine10-N2)-dimethyltransferase
MAFIFHLTGENDTLPKAEVLAVLESMNINFRILYSFEQVLVLEAGDLRDAPRRLGMTHGVYEYLGCCGPNYRDILSLTKSIAQRVSHGFAVRIKRIREHSKDLKRDALERDMGRVIGKRVNLSQPSCLIVGFLTDRFVLGRLIRSLDGTRFPSRHPKDRPFFHPGVLLPRTARAVVNLTRVKPGEKLVDPFCGTGGILIEAGLIGAEVHGCDIDAEKVRGCEKNLGYYGIKNYKTHIADARGLWEEYSNFFDALATDPPYGISASTKGLGLDELYRESIESFYKMLKDGKYACLVAPHAVRTEEYAEKAGFQIIEKHLERVHRSLTRKILVMRKWS